MTRTAESAKKYFYTKVKLVSNFSPISNVNYNLQENRLFSKSLALLYITIFCASLYAQKYIILYIIYKI